MININNVICITMKSTVKSRLQDLLKSSNQTEFELSKASGVEYTTINRILSGETSKPSKSTVRLLANALNTSFDYLYYGTVTAPAGGNDLAKSDPYKDYLVQKLEKEVEEWKAEYRWMKQLVNDLRNGVTLGKLKRIKETAQGLAA